MNLTAPIIIMLGTKGKPGEDPSSEALHHHHHIQSDHRHQNYHPHPRHHWDTILILNGVVILTMMRMATNVIELGVSCIFYARVPCFGL